MSTKTRTQISKETLPARLDDVDVVAPNATILRDKLGVVTHIHHDVVAKMVGLAVREVEGVYDLVPFDTTQRLSSLARSISGETMKNLGVHVEVGQVEAAVDVRLITVYGMPIPTIARALQKNVSERVEGMTGLKVKEINIEVVDLYFEEEAMEQQKLKQGPKEPRVR